MRILKLVCGIATIAMLFVPTISCVEKMNDIPDVPEDVIEISKEKGKGGEKDPFSYGQVLTLCDYFCVSDEEKKSLLTL